MRTMMTLSTFTVIFTLLISVSFTVVSAEDSKNNLTEHEQWLKNKFSEQHQKLIPIVAVADMLFSCNSANDSAYGKYSLETLITKMNKEKLAEKLMSCLGNESINSDMAINYGLLGCFNDQLKELPSAERKAKIKLVEKAILSLSLDERKKSFTQCVTDQSISYLK